MIELVKLIDVIVGFTSPVVRNKLQRNELVIKLLKQINLDPDHPPADFTAVYQYTLVEYGIGKPRPVLEIFRQLEIQAVFRKALDQNNPALLLQEGERFLSSHTLGDQIRELGIDARREFYQFAAIFIEVAKRTRTPAEVLTNQRLESLNQQIGTVQERLTRLPTLEGMRTEIARLAAQSLALPAAESQDQQCRAFALAQQMKGWFETLGYRFETHEVWQDDYFEWVINIPVRRGRYDRILVRGMEGAAEIGDVGMLRQSVEQQHTDEGWLITTRRISRAARDEVEKSENAHLGCYTFDELLDQDADFSGYLNWLEAEIQQRQIEQKYVPLACTKEELDPVTQQRIAVSRYDDRDGWIDGYIDQWLDDPVKEHISVLGEFGTGKTWFALHYAWVVLQRYRDAQKRGVDRPRLPLVIPLRDYAKAVSVESLFSEFFFRKHEIPIPGYSAFEQLNRMGKLLLIFDGFDEMAARVDRQEMINNFWELAKIVVPGAKVILTCRTEHFPEVKEGRALLNAELKASTINLNEDTPQFEVLELEKFDDEQIQQVLTLQTSPEVVQQVMNNAQLLDLARRPVMTELILEALPDIEAGKPVDMSRVYLYAVQRKMERDIKEERTFTSLADKLYFLCELSWEMLSNDRMSLNYREFPDRIRRLFGSVVQEEKDLDHWHYDMMGQTMLIRNADGDYMPAHRSLLEFFVAYKFAAELGALAPDFLELAQMRSDVDHSLLERSYTWSKYFEERRQVAPLSEFMSEDLEKLRLGIGKVPLSKAVIDLVLPMLPSFTLSPLHPLIKIIEETQGRDDADIGYFGGNAASLLIKLNKSALEKKNLTRAVIIGADFTNASLHYCDFTEANLTNSRFAQALGTALVGVFSSDGKVFVTGEANGDVRLWQVQTGQEVLICKGHQDWVRTVAFSSDRNVLVSGSDDGKIKLWNTGTGECIKTLDSHAGRVYSVALNLTGTILASTDDQDIRIWDVQSGTCLKILTGHTSRINSVIISSDDSVLISGSDDQTIKIWDVKSGNCLKTLTGHTNRINSVAIDSDTSIVVSGSDDQTARVWSVQNGRCLIVLKGHISRVNSVAISPDGNSLATGGSDAIIKFWNILTGQCFITLRNESSGLNSIAFSPIGSVIAATGNDQTVKFWNFDTGICEKVLKGQVNQVYSVAMHSESRILASGGGNQSIKIWDTKTGECLKILYGHCGLVWSISISLDGKTAISGSADETVKVWNIQTGECVRTLQEHTSKVYSVAVSADNKIIASGSDDRTVKLWDALTGKCLKTLSGHTDKVWSVAISPSGKVIASASRDTTVRLWDINSGECLDVLQAAKSSVNSLAFSLNGEILASGDDDQNVKIWNTNSGECIKILQGHSSRVHSISISSDGMTLVSGSSDSTIKFWELQSGECLRTIQEFTRPVWSIALSSDGKTVASGGFDEAVTLWSVETGECVKTILDRPYEGMNITGVKGLTETEKATLKALGAIEH